MSNIISQYAIILLIQDGQFWHYLLNIINHAVIFFGDLAHAVKHFSIWSGYCFNCYNIIIATPNWAYYIVHHHHCIVHTAENEFISCLAPFMHVQERVWLKGSHFLVMEVHVCILRPNQVAELWSYDISGLQLCAVYMYARSLAVCTRYRSGS